MAKSSAATVATEPAAASTKGYISETFAKKVFESLPEGDRSTVNKKSVHAVLDAFVRLIVRDTMNGETTTITNFVSFKRVMLKAQEFRKPTNGKGEAADAATVHKPERFKMAVTVMPAMKRLMESVDVPK